MLITISGMVGSGKSTTAARAAELLAEAGLQPRSLRFRYLGLFGFSQPRRSPERNDSERTGAPAARGSGFTLRPLTAARTAGYAVRIVAFRLSGVGGAARCDILDRYFYDNLVQYRLTSWIERLYAFVLRQLIPAPDLAILVIASSETIAARRRNYAREYVVEAGQRYEALADLFPRLVTIRTDERSLADDEIRRAIENVIGRARQA
jgi:thymidylate kinase